MLKYYKKYSLIHMFFVINYKEKILRSNYNNMDDKEILYEVDFDMTNDTLYNGTKRWVVSAHSLFCWGTLILGIMLMVPAVFDFAMKSYRTAAFYFVAGVIFFLERFLTPISLAKKDLKKLHEIFGTDENCGHYNYKFRNNNFVMNTSFKSNTYMYSQLKKVYDYKDILVLDLSPKGMMIIDKSSVTTENEDELFEFLKKKLEQVNGEENISQNSQKKKISDIISESEEISKE